MRTDKKDIGWFKRLLLAIPFLRHKLVRESIKASVEERSLQNVINRSISYMIAPNLVGLFNEGKMDVSAFSDPSYFKNTVFRLFGKKANIIASQIKIEKAILRSSPKTQISLVIIPSSKDIGQSDIVAFVVNSKNQAYTYCWEWSLNQTHMICAWQDENHINYGECNDKVEFVKQILSISEDWPSEKQYDDERKFDDLDLKHRLAKEIGVRFEKLDFYMTTFQNMVYSEMCGIDTLGIPEGIDDEEEWLRYLSWEINQAKKRMSPEELAQSKQLLNSLIERDHAKEQQIK